jgi:hypothetical protein
VKRTGLNRGLHLPEPCSRAYEGTQLHGRGLSLVLAAAVQ